MIRHPLPPRCLPLRYFLPVEMTSSPSAAPVSAAAQPGFIQQQQPQNIEEARAMAEVGPRPLSLMPMLLLLPMRLHTMRVELIGHFKTCMTGI